MSPDDQAGARPGRASLNALSLVATADLILDFGDRRRSRKDEETGANQLTNRSREKALRLVDEIGELCARTRLFHLLSQAPEDSLVSDVHLFEMLRAVNACNTRLRLIHQALMSLYPAVAAELVESVRLAAIDPDALINPSPASSDPWNDALKRTTETLSSVRSALSGRGG